MEEPFLTPREARSLARQYQGWLRSERALSRVHIKDPDLAPPSPLETDVRFLVRLYGHKILFIVGKYAVSLLTEEEREELRNVQLKAPAHEYELPNF